MKAYTNSPVCPECMYVMSVDLDNKTTMCNSVNCREYRKIYKWPTVELEPVGK